MTGTEAGTRPAECRSPVQRVVSGEVMAMVGGVRDSLGLCRDAGSMPQ